MTVPPSAMVEMILRKLGEQSEDDAWYGFLRHANSLCIFNAGTQTSCECARGAGSGGESGAWCSKSGQLDLRCHQPMSQCL